MLRIGYAQATYTMVFTEESTEAALGGSGIRLAYACAVHKAIHTRVVLDRNSRSYIWLAYALDMRFYIHLRLPPARAAAARAIVIVSICRAYASK